MHEPEDDPRAYVRVAEFVRKQVTDGMIAPGKPVPSITELAEQFSYSRGTCRKALQLLEGEGLLSRYLGLGYFVRAAASDEAAPRPPS